MHYISTYIKVKLDRKQWKQIWLKETNFGGFETLMPKVEVNEVIKR